MNEELEEVIRDREELIELLNEILGVTTGIEHLCATRELAEINAKAREHMDKKGYN